MQKTLISINVPNEWFEVKEKLNTNWAYILGVGILTMTEGKEQKELIAKIEKMSNVIRDLQLRMYQMEQVKP